MNTNNLLSETDAQAVLAILVEELEVTESELKPEARIVHDLGADSLDVMEIVLALEERFNVSLPDDVADRISTVNDIFEVLAELTATNRNQAQP